MDILARMSIRLRHIAERAGVSEATVSRVINERAGVNEQTRAAVLRVVTDLGYEPPGVRRRHRAGLVGLVVPELTNPIFPAFAQSISSLLASRGYTTLLCTATSDGVQEDEHFESLIARGVDGIVVISGKNAVPAADHDLYRRSASAGLHLVLINGGPVAGIDATFISCDDRFASELAVTHLASLGHRRIGCLVGPSRYWPVQRKIAGFNEAAAALGLEGEVVETLYSVEGGHSGGRALLRKGVTGIIAASDLMALGAVRAADEVGRSVPVGCSVIGYDDTPLMEFTNPPLTTIRQPVAAMCRAALAALLHTDDQPSLATGEMLFRPELVVRGTTGTAPQPPARQRER
jgi:LacI family transcriptional regulator, repressor for deo operon, udp, cdd, tsx, nupC, and nupG